ncbi:MAG: protoporphyrinogen oxidase [Deltaproteobacteria bacterium]|nr:protoporphyrinogen oxidase [Deltaproteobacteria bacterium]
MKSKSEGDESIASFVRRRAGREALERLADPFVSGVYAGDTEQLSTSSVFPQLIELERTYGSVFKGLMKRKKEQKGSSSLFSFRWGMGTLPARLEEVLRGCIQCDTTIDGMEQLPRGGLSIRAEAPRRTYEADAVVLATPSWMSARILAQLLPGVIAPLMAIPYAPLAVVHTVFRRSDLPRDLSGFGCLIPRCEGIRLLGSLWSSSLFSGRCPPDQALLTNYIGGMTDSRVIELEDHEILTHVMSGLETVLKITSQPHFVHMTRLVQAIPQYMIGHRERLAEIANFLVRQPNIFLTGNYFRGVSVADSIAHARETADKVLTHLGVWSPGKK